MARNFNINNINVNSNWEETLAWAAQAAEGLGIKSAVQVPAEMAAEMAVQAQAR